MSVHILRLPSVSVELNNYSHGAEGCVIKTQLQIGETLNMITSATFRGSKTILVHTLLLLLCLVKSHVYFH